MTAYPPATKPTFYFIGVSTHQSSIMRVFPRWAAHLGLGDVAIQGINFAPNTAPELYREAVAFIKRDPLSVGALITTHKLDLFAACRDLFDEVDPLAALMGEASCISKRGGRLTGFAKDAITAGLTLDHMLPARYFETTRAELFCMGAGGAAVPSVWSQRRG
jgi:shikimate 5-dehydrogenase